MAKLVVQTFTFDDLTAQNYSSRFAAYRGEDILLAMTDLPELGWSVLNLFSPLNKAFFFFRQYGALSRSIRDWAAPLVADLPTHRHLQSTLRRMRVSTKSLVAGWLLGAVPAMSGEKYKVVFSNSYRHFSTSCPISKKADVIEHFERQVLSFGQQSCFYCEEATRLVHSVGGPSEPLIGHLPVHLYPQRRLDHLHELRRQLSEIVQSLDRRARFVESLSPAYFAWTPWSFSRAFPEFSECPELSNEIILLRAQLLRQLAWPSYYDLVFDILNNPVEFGLPRLVQEELMAYMNEIEATFPVVTDNPLG
jgi:hypothetical protein